MSNNFSERFKLVYQVYMEMVEKIGSKPSESGLARFLGVSQTTVQRWKNYQLPDSESLKSIHDKLGFSYDWLIAGEGEPFDDMREKVKILEKEVAYLRSQIMVEGASIQDAIVARAAGQE